MSFPLYGWRSHQSIYLPLGVWYLLFHCFRSLWGKGLASFFRAYGVDNLLGATTLYSVSN
jgi:hypothetical protein